MSAGTIELIQRLHQHIVATADVAEDACSGELAAVLGALQRCVNSLSEVQRRATAAAVRSDTWALDGFRTPSRWVALHTGLTAAFARTRCVDAVEAAAMPTASAA